MINVLQARQPILDIVFIMVYCINIIIMSL